MKKLILLLLLSNFVLANSAINISFYDKLFEDLAKKRVGLSEEEINNLKDPFPTQSTKREITQDVEDQLGYTLYGIFGDRVKINESWYKIGDSVNNFEVKEVLEKSVILSNDTQEIEIKLRQGSKHVTITY